MESNRNFLEPVEWSHKQEEILNAKPNFIITGPAGTGKTLLAINLAKKCWESGNTVAVIVFTKYLRTYIEDYLSKYSITGGK